MLPVKANKRIPYFFVKFVWTFPVNLAHPLLCAVIRSWLGGPLVSLIFVRLLPPSGTCDGYGSASGGGSSCSSRRWPGSPLTSRWKTTASWRSSACLSSTPTRWSTSASQKTTCTGTQHWHELIRWALKTRHNLHTSQTLLCLSGGTWICSWLALSTCLSVPPTGQHWSAQTLSGLAGRLGQGERDRQHGCRHPQVADGRWQRGSAVLHHHLQPRGPPLSQRKQVPGEVQNTVVSALRRRPTTVSVRRVFNLLTMDSVAKSLSRTFRCNFAILVGTPRLPMNPKMCEIHLFMCSQYTENNC